MGDQRRGGIAWTDETWNVVRGCSRVSAGCEKCYAERQSIRMSGPGGAYEGLVRSTPSGPRWTGDVRLVPEKLGDPLRWTRPRRIFVNAMSDLFHEKLSDEDIAAVYGVMAACPQHQFQVLTKRPERRLEWQSRVMDCGGGQSGVVVADVTEYAGRFGLDITELWNLAGGRRSQWPLPNVSEYVSVEDQVTADERIPILLDTPAAIRGVSYEPALGPVRFSGAGWDYLRGYATDWVGDVIGTASLDHVIVGGESGPGARPCDVEWIRSVVEHCREAGVACFTKQLGARPYFGDGGGVGAYAHRENRVLHLNDPKGGDPSEWPEDLRVQEFPRIR